MADLAIYFRDSDCSFLGKLRYSLRGDGSLRWRTTMKKKELERITLHDENVTIANKEVINVFYLVLEVL